jgi:hypothetical protein
MTSNLKTILLRKLVLEILEYELHLKLVVLSSIDKYAIASSQMLHVTLEKIHLLEKYWAK